MDSKSSSGSVGAATATTVTSATSQNPGATVSSPSSGALKKSSSHATSIGSPFPDPLDELKLPKRPWNVNKKAYTKKEPSIPWYKRQSRTPVWAPPPEPVIGRSGRHSEGPQGPPGLHAGGGQHGRNSSASGLNKLRSGRNSNDKNNFDLGDIRDSKLFRKISTNAADGVVYDWSVNNNNNNGHKGLTKLPSSGSLKVLVDDDNNSQTNPMFQHPHTMTEESKGQSDRAMSGSPLSPAASSTLLPSASSSITVTASAATTPAPTTSAAGAPTSSSSTALSIPTGAVSTVSSVPVSSSALSSSSVAFSSPSAAATVIISPTSVSDVNVDVDVELDTIYTDPTSSAQKAKSQGAAAGGSGGSGGGGGARRSSSTTTAASDGDAVAADGEIGDDSNLDIDLEAIYKDPLASARKKKATGELSADTVGQIGDSGVVRSPQLFSHENRLRVGGSGAPTPALTMDTGLPSAISRLTQNLLADTAGVDAHASESYQFKSIIADFLDEDNVADTSADFVDAKCDVSADLVSTELLFSRDGEEEEDDEEHFEQNELYMTTLQNSSAIGHLDSSSTVLDDSAAVDESKMDLTMLSTASSTTAAALAAAAGAGTGGFNSNSNTSALMLTPFASPVKGVKELDLERDVQSEKKVLPFSMNKICILCDKDIAELSVEDHLRHIYQCMEVTKATTIPKPPATDTPSIDGSKKVVKFRDADVGRGVMSAGLDGGSPRTGSSNETSWNREPEKPVAKVMVTLDTGTQTPASLLEEYEFMRIREDRSKDGAILQQQTKLSRDISVRMNKIIEQKSQMLNNNNGNGVGGSGTTSAGSGTGSGMSSSSNSNKLSSVTEGPMNDDETDLNLPEIYPAPSIAALEDRVAKAKEDRSKRYNLVGPSLSDGDTAMSAKEEKDLNKLRRELTELLAKQSEFRVKERKLRMVIKKSMKKSKVPTATVVTPFNADGSSTATSLAASASSSSATASSSAGPETATAASTKPEPGPGRVKPALGGIFQELQKKLKFPGAEKPEEKSAPEETSAISSQEDDLPAHLKKYQLMLKRGVPLPGVIAKMNLEGISPEDQKLVLKALQPSGSSSPWKKKESEASSSAAAQSQAPKLIAFHWDILEKDKIEANPNNIWKQLTNKASGSVLQDAEREKLVVMFAKKDAASLKSKKKADEDAEAAKSNSGSKATTRKVLDFARSVSISIVLSVFKSRAMEVDKICEGINHMDFHVLQLDDALRVKDIMPTEAEVKSFKELSKVKNFTVDDLVEVEQAMYKLCQIEFLKEKVSVLLFLLTWGTSVKNLTTKCEILASTTETAIESQGLGEVMSTILAIGNAMNAGTYKGSAAGFRINSLLKLNQTKSTNGMYTVLDFLIQTLFSREQNGNMTSSLALGIDDELSAGITVSKLISMPDLEMELKSFENDCCQFGVLLQREWDDPLSTNPNMSELKEQHKSIALAIIKARDKIEKAKVDVKEFEGYFVEAPESCANMLSILDEFVTALHKAKEKHVLLQRTIENNKNLSNPLARTPRQRKSQVLKAVDQAA